MKFLEYYALLLILLLDFEIASARDNLTHLHIVKNIFSISSLYIFWNKDVFILKQIVAVCLGWFGEQHYINPNWPQQQMQNFVNTKSIFIKIRMLPFIRIKMKLINLHPSNLLGYLLSLLYLAYWNFKSERHFQGDKAS